MNVKVKISKLKNCIFNGSQKILLAYLIPRKIKIELKVSTNFQCAMTYKKKQLFPFFVFKA